MNIEVKPTVEHDTDTLNEEANSKQEDASSTPENETINPFVAGGHIEESLMPKMPLGYVFKEDGLYLSESKDSLFVSGHITVSAQTFDPRQKHWGRVIIHLDPRNNLVTHYLNNGDMMSPMKVAGKFMNSGLQIGTKQTQALIEYIVAQKPMLDIELASRTGWMICESGQRAYVRPKRIISYSGSDHDNHDSKVHFSPRNDLPLYQAHCTQGTLEQWQRHISEPCLGSPVLMAMQCFSLASILLDPLGIEGFGIDINGLSSRGKTTAIQVAASVIGDAEDPATARNGIIRSLNTTDNAIELIAEPSNDSVLFLDEHGNSSISDIGKMIYGLANGEGKQRMDQDGTARATAHWKCLTLINGEFPIHDSVDNLKAGQMVRFLSLPVGEIEIINAESTEAAAAFADQLKLACSRYYGTAVEAFVETLLAQFHVDSGYFCKLKIRYTQIHSELCAEEFSAQQRRALKRFALLILAGELGVEFNVLCGESQEYRRAVESLITLWAEQSSPISDAARAVISVKEFIEANPGRFPSKGEIRESSGTIAGYFDREAQRYLLTETGLREATGGVADNRSVLRELVSMGLLHRNNQSNFKSLYRIAQVGARLALYGIDARLIGDSDSNVATSELEGSSRPPLKLPDLPSHSSHGCHGFTDRVIIEGL